MSRTRKTETQKSSKQKDCAYIGRLVVTGVLVMATQLAWGEMQQPSRDTRPGQERVASMDSNKDGMLSLEETEKLPRFAKHFNRIDANRDGQLTKDEMRAAREHAQRFQEENFSALRELESESHQARIQILQQADACIRAASTPEAYRQCEQKERSARLELRELMKTKRQALMASQSK